MLNYFFLIYMDIYVQLLSFEPNTVLHRSKIRFIEERSRDAKKQGGKRRGKEGAKGEWGGSFATAMQGTASTRSPRAVHLEES